MWLWIIDEHGSAFLQGSMETGDWFVWFVWFVWIVSTGRIPFIASELLFTFHSDTNNDPAQGFSIQVIQVTDCSPVTGPVPPPLHIKQPLCQLALTPPTAHVTSDAFLDQDLSVCSYDVIHQPGFILPAHCVPLIAHCVPLISVSYHSWPIYTVKLSS